MSASERNNRLLNEKGSRMQHAGAGGKCDYASQQPVNGRAPRGFLFVSARIAYFSRLPGNDDVRLDLLVGQCLGARRRGAA